MKQILKSTAAALVGVGALALLAAPSFAASDQSATKAGAPVQLAHMGQAQGGSQGTGQPCSMGMMAPGAGGQGMMAPGYGHGSGYSMDRQRMMGPQGMMRPDMGAQSKMGLGFGKRPGLGSQVVPSKDLTADDVRHFLDHRLEMHGNKRLKVGEVKEADDDNIVAHITTVDGSLVERLEVDRHSGKMRHIE